MITISYDDLATIIIFAVLFIIVVILAVTDNGMPY